MAQQIIHYQLTVHRGARAGLTKAYGYSQRIAARRFADKLDREYGAICCSVRPIFADVAVLVGPTQAGAV